MKESKPMMSFTDDELQVCEILINLKYLIKKYSVALPVWGAKRRRSTINLSLTPSPPPEEREEKRVKVSPTAVLAFSPSESDDKSDDKAQEFFVKKVVKKKTKEELLETINQLAQARESLTMELEKVKGHHNKLIAYNMELKAKQQELKETAEPKESTIELTKSTMAPPLLLENSITYYPHFSNLLQQQPPRQNFFTQYPSNPTPSYSLQTGLPDLNANVMCDEVFYDMEQSQSFDQNVQAIGDSYKAIVAAEARKRRMVRVKEMKVKC